MFSGGQPRGTFPAPSRSGGSSRRRVVRSCLATGGGKFAAGKPGLRVQAPGTSGPQKVPFNVCKKKTGTGKQQENVSPLTSHRGGGGK